MTKRAENIISLRQFLATFLVFITFSFFAKLVFKISLISNYF